MPMPSGTWNAQNSACVWHGSVDEQHRSCVMVRQLPELDEVMLIGSTNVAVIPVSPVVLGARLGFEVRRDPDFLPGLGTFDHFSIEIDDRVVCTIAVARARNHSQ